MGNGVSSWNIILSAFIRRLGELISLEGAGIIAGILVGLILVTDMVLLSKTLGVLIVGIIFCCIAWPIIKK